MFRKFLIQAIADSIFINAFPVLELFQHRQLAF